MDFFKIVLSEVKSGPRKGEYDIIPDFQVSRFTDLMVKGKQFYAIWDEEAGLWSTDEYDVQRLVDEELRKYAEKLDISAPFSVKYLRSSSNGSWRAFKNFVNLLSDNAHELNSNLTFLNTPVKKEDYVSHRLPYALAPGDCPAYEELIGTLYSVEERAKIEWIIGCIVAGDSKYVQKFGVLYGPPGSGKGTILDIIERLFQGYTTSFDAKALGNANAQFATEAFGKNPLVAIQQDADLSRLNDNTKINSIVSHEKMVMNEKYKPTHSSRVNAFLLVGTNEPVKITTSKSGLLRRLIDISPTGVNIREDHYHALMAKVDFELGAIAAHCLKVYREMGKQYYSGYRPNEMMLQTNVFFNFIEYNWDIFKQQDGTTLSQAYHLYKQYCSDANIEKVRPMYEVREELKSYFKEYKDRGRFNNADVRSLYIGFNAHPFKAPVKGAHAYSLVLDLEESLLDEVLADCPAQQAVYDPEKDLWRPKYKWENSKTTLVDVDTHELHYVRVPQEHIVVDFDLTDESGNKSFERNIEAASNWPATYGELSQGGNGVHLHYLYDGDVSQLSSTYSRGIEVKVFDGHSSLRRRVTKCNNYPISTLREGALPLKEKRVLSEKTIQDERHLRNLIMGALQKRVHPHTKSNVDFIKKVTDEAYESGLSYDVTDLKPKVISFANSSSNQSSAALNVVMGIHWKSELVDEDAIMEDQPEKPIVVYDVEVYPNLFVVCWKFRGAPADTIVDMINPTPQQIEELVSRYRLIGFYNRRFDNHMLYARMLGYTNQQLFDLSQKIIVGNRNDALFGEAYNLSYADIWDYSSIKKSLKKFQIDLGLHHMESSIPWNKPVPDEQIPLVVKYCRNDVQTTDEVADDREGDFKARQILAELSGLSVNHTTQAHTGKIIFGDDRNPQASFVYTNLKEEFPGYVYDAGKSYYRDEEPGEGGYVYAEPGYHENVALLDVASMHPTSIRVLNLFGPYTKQFNDLVDARLAIKNKDLVKAGKLLDGRLKPFITGEPSDLKNLSDALKIVINIVYGLTAARFPNKFKDDRNRDNIVAKRGALFMIDLKHHIQDLGYTVAHIKTDSVKIPNADDFIIEQVMKFGDKYGYTFEYEANYDKLLLANDAVYVARDAEDGQWHATGAQFQEPWIFKNLFSGEIVNLNDLAQAKQVTKGTMYLDLEYDKPPPVVEGMQYIGKSGLFYPVKEGTRGAGVLYRRSDEDKLFSVTGTKGYLWIEAEIAKNLGEFSDEYIDYRYFDKLMDAAKKTIEQFVSVEDLLN